MVTIDAGKFKRCENGKILLKLKKERMFHASCINTNAIKVAYITEIIFTYYEQHKMIGMKYHFTLLYHRHIQKGLLYELCN